MPDVFVNEKHLKSSPAAEGGGGAIKFSAKQGEQGHAANC